LIHHPDIIEYYDSFLSMDNIYIVMEYAAKGDIAAVIFFVDSRIFERGRKGRRTIQRRSFGRRFRRW
jgi:serine/threonine protein kinase